MPNWPSYGPTYQAPYQPAPAKSNATIIIVIVLIVIVVVGVIGAIVAITVFDTTIGTFATQHSFGIANGQIVVPAGRYYYYQFNLPPGAILAQVTGTFSTSSGNIRVLVMDWTNYLNWQNNGTASYCYDSGQTTSGAISASLPGSGTYDLVYSNILSGNLTVQTTVSAYYRG